MKKKTPLAETLTALLEQKRLTMKEAARLAKIPRSSLQGWCHGTSPSNFQEVKRLADVLGCSLQFLLLGHNDTDPRIEERQRELVFEGLCVLRLEKIVLPGTGNNE
jgi:transcriptional regulator with XRE-family HTH domain